MIEKYRIKRGHTLSWGGTRKYSKEILRNNSILYYNTEWDNESIKGKAGETFTVECIAKFNRHYCPPEDDDYLYEITTTTDRLIGGIDEENFFKCADYKYEFLGYVNDNEEEEII